MIDDRTYETHTSKFRRTTSRFFRLAVLDAVSSNKLTRPARTYAPKSNPVVRRDDEMYAYRRPVRLLREIINVNPPPYIIE